MSGRNPYHVLGLKKGAREAEIKEAYKLLAKRHHPDRNPKDRQALARFLEIKAAYDELRERKSEKVLSLAEETVAEVTREANRRQIPRIVLWSLAIAIALFSSGGAAWKFYLKDFGYHRGLAAAATGDPGRAAGLLAPAIRGGGAKATRARLALAAGWLRAWNLAKAEEALVGAEDPISLAVLGDIRLEPRDSKPGSVAAARKAASIAWRAAWERAKSGGGTPAERAEAEARAFAGFLRIGDAGTAQRIASDAIRDLPAERWSRWMASFVALRAGAAPSSPVDETSPVDRALAAALRVARAHEAALRQAEDDSNLDEAMRGFNDVFEGLDAADREGNVEPFPFGFPYPEPEVIRRRANDWRPTTSTEDPRNAVLLSIALAARLGDSKTKMAAAAGLLKTGDVESMRRRPVYSAFVCDAKGLLLLRSSQQVDVAAGLFNVAASLVPEDSVALAGMALVAREREKGTGSPQAEFDAWRRAMAADPGRAEYHVALARALRRMSRHAEAVAEDRAAVKEDPGFGAAWLDLGDSLREAKQVAEGLLAWETAARIPESAREAGASLGDWYYGQKQFPAALAAFALSVSAAKSEGIGRDPRLADAWFRIACIHSMAHRQAEGLDAIRHANAAGLHEIARYTLEPSIQWLLERVDVRGIDGAGGKP